MKSITFELTCWLRFKFEMVEFPQMTSTKKFIQKGLNLLKNHAPRILSYLSRQETLSKLKDYKIILKTRKKKPEHKIKKKFHRWLRKEKAKRLILLVIEALLIPFSVLLALLPGPNVFFYVPALLFYYHLNSYRGLKKVEAGGLDIEIIYTQP